MSKNERQRVKFQAKDLAAKSKAATLNKNAVSSSLLLLRATLTDPRTELLPEHLKNKAVDSLTELVAIDSAARGVLGGDFSHDIIPLANAKIANAGAKRAQTFLASLFAAIEKAGGAAA